MHLSGRDLDAFQRALLALHECADEECLVRSLPSILLKLVRADYIYLLDFKFSPQLDRAKLIGMVDPAGQISREMALFAQDRLLDHPFPQYYARTGIRTTLIMSDFQSVHQFRRTDAYQRFYRHLGADRQIAFPADFGMLRVGGITLCNRGRDFTERDRSLLNLFLPHIEVAHRNARRWTAWSRLRGSLPPVYKLTRREAEIARWLAAGKTNSEISSILVANVRTVEKHMESILTKLGVENRTTAAIFLAKALDPDHAALPTGNGGRDVDGFPDGEAANGAG